MELLDDGKILIAGMYEEEDGDYDDVPVFVRLHPNGTLDAAFGAGGLADLGSSFNLLFLSSYYSIPDIKTQNDGKILLCATTEDTDEEFAVLRVNEDGTPDNFFGSGGLVVTNITSGLANFDYAVELLPQPDGKIIVVGNSADFPGQFALVRYHTDGAVDISYGNNGIAAFQFGNSVNNATAVILQPDGKTLVTGKFGDEGANLKIGLARFTATGTLDSTFGNNGFVLTHIECNSTRPFCMALDSNKIYVGGIASLFYYTYHFMVVRYLNDICFAPSSDFNYSLNGQDVQFTDQSEGAALRMWDFGDGTIDTLQNPMHTFSLPGIYHVCLIATNDCEADTMCQEISLVATSGESLSMDDFRLTIAPNPFSKNTLINFYTQKREKISIELFDLQGRKIKTLVDGILDAGSHQVNLEKENLPAGLYHVRLEASDYHHPEIFKQVMKTVIVE